jgi:hypothetical protein
LPVTQTLTASRNATWAPTLNYYYAGAALPAIDHIAMQIRLYAGAADPPLLACNPIDFADALVSGSAGGADEQRCLTLSPSLTPEQLATLPGLNTPEAGNPQSFAFDILITYADEVSEVLSSGTIIVQPGVTTV